MCIQDLVGPVLTEIGFMHIYRRVDGGQTLNHPRINGHDYVTGAHESNFDTIG